MLQVTYGLDGQYYGGFSRSWQTGLRLSHLLVVVPLHPYLSAGYLKVQYSARAVRTIRRQRHEDRVTAWCQYPRVR